MSDRFGDPGFGLYIHWPFCAAKCPYCDFNSHVVAAVDQARWCAALRSEVRRVAGEVRRPLRSIFFGGGTPSLMLPETVFGILGQVRDCFELEEDCEVTLEANPTSVEADRFEGYRDAGVNRVSLGIQALRDPDLKRLGRLHDTAEAVAALGIARQVFDRVSFDLIYARQDQSAEAWAAELTQAIDLGPDHLSLYQLTIEPGTAFWDRQAAGGLRGLPDDDLGAELYELTLEICSGAGLPAYEVSNHARPGAQSRHNLIYWRMGDYAGIGPGAHGRLTLESGRVATETWRAPNRWLAAVEQAGHGESARTRLDVRDVAVEWALMGLRLADGIDLRSANASVIDAARLQDMVGDGLVEIDEDVLRATGPGRLVLNGILREILSNDS